MKMKTAMLLLGVLLLTACSSSTPAAEPVSAKDVVSTKALAATETLSPTPTHRPTYTPRPTSTPLPAVKVVTDRPSGNARPIKITGAIGGDYKTENIPQSLFMERVTWVADIKFNYTGGRVLLAGARDGMKPLVVDDVLTIKVLHQDGTSATFDYDFSFNSNGPQLAGPFDMTEYFQVGLNMLYVTIYDYGYSAWGTDGLWIVEFK